MRNLLVAQSGGPTAAINATVAGVVSCAVLSGKVDHIYGAVNGIEGVLAEKFLDLGKKLDSVTGAELKSWYDIYCQIGGYPSVVREYLNSKSIERARSELIRIIDTFMNESIRYFTDVLDTQVFTDIFLSI